MPRAIIGFRQDEGNPSEAGRLARAACDDGQWIAELACGHTQHVRHDPPWQVRPWTTTAEGRAGRIGTTLPCAECARTAG